jgi:hypothetical protein
MKLVDLVFMAIIAACLLSLMGCSDRSEPLPVIAAPAMLRGWSPQEECALAQILQDYPSDSILWTLHDDWSRMRREIGLKPTKTNFKCRSIDAAHLLS